jgi:YVTN family beta-propeller protein
VSHVLGLGCDQSFWCPVGLNDASGDLWDVAVDPATREVFVVDHIAGAVLVIDTATRQVTDTVRVGRSPTRVAADPARGEVHVTNDLDATVWGIVMATA